MPLRYWSDEAFTRAARREGWKQLPVSLPVDTEPSIPAQWIERAFASRRDLLDLGRGPPHGQLRSQEDLPRLSDPVVEPIHQDLRGRSP